MEKIKTDFLSRLLYGIIVVALILLSITLLSLPWSMSVLLKGTAFYHTVPSYKILILLYVTGIPAWVILRSTKQLAKNIIARDPFSKSGSQSLKIISICSLIIFFSYLLACIVIGPAFGLLMITVAAFGIALIAAILYRLVDLAMEIKEENDLTI